MRVHLSFPRSGLALAGAALMSLGLAGLVQAQSTRPGIVQFSTGESSYLGIQMEDVTPASMATYKLGSERGVIVVSVEKGSPAESAGLQAKDVVLEYAGTPVFSSMQMTRLVRETPVGRKVDIVVSRDGKKVTLTPTVGRREGADNVTRRFEVVPRGEFPDREQPESRGFMFRMPEMDEFPFGWQGRGAVPPGRPRLGVSMQPLTDQMAAFLGVPGKEGAMIIDVTEGSPAAGRLKAGDVIVKADGRKRRLARRLEPDGTGQEGRCRPRPPRDQGQKGNQHPDPVARRRLQAQNQFLPALRPFTLGAFRVQPTRRTSKAPTADPPLFLLIFTFSSPMIFRCRKGESR